ncbi:MAG TPA: hypothetical protein PLM53_00150 [Spirochaetota bacterium]|nr:hypothetical protein [Spirochaetota bacterium]HQF06904.1 hypothetical protein [Spirochaetota bacterium]HQH95477.1 hypothetical protein [Spirochaetota bacterium]
MLKKRLFGLLLLAAFIFSATALFAQAKPQDKKAQDKKGVELVEPVKQEKPKGKEKLMIFNGEYLKAQLYGFVRFDMVYNTTDVRHESSPLLTENHNVYFNPLGTSLATQFITAGTSSQKLFTIKKTAAQRGGSFVIDMRVTRLGLIVKGPKVLLADTMAQVEFDFWGTMTRSGTGNRQGMIRMRHALGRFDWPSGTFLVIGQYWSVAMAMPAQPLTATFIPFGENGNLFMREPMIWLGQKIGNDKFNVTIEAAAARVQAGADSGQPTDLFPGDNGVQLDDRGPGEASKYPGGRARITFVVNPNEIFNLTFGGTGHYQLERHAFNLASYTNNLIWGTAILTTNQQAFLAQKWSKLTKSYSAQAFGKVQVSLVTLLAAYWRGNNMDTFLNGGGQNGAVENFTSTKILGIPMQGGYAQVQIDLRKVAPIPLLFSAAYGGIKKSNKRNIALGNIQWNECILANVFWYLNDYIHVAFEYGRHQTQWKGNLGPSVDHKYHTQVQFSF